MPYLLFIMCQLLTKQEKKVELQGQYFKLHPESRKQARLLAIEEGVSLSEWIADAVQTKIDRAIAKGVENEQKNNEVQKTI